MITTGDAYLLKKKPMTVSKYHHTEEQLAEEQLHVAAAQKDANAFGVLYRKYYEQIYRYVYQRMDTRDQADDVTAQVFLKALNNIKKYKFKGVPFSSWLYRIAYSEINNYYNQHKKQRTVNVDTANLGEMLEEDSEDAALLLQRKEKLIEAFAKLDADALSIIEMRFFEKRSFKEIAEILEITENNAKVKTYRILDKLRKRLIG